MKTIHIKPEAVGLAFQQQLGVMIGQISRRSRKLSFMKLRRTLINLDLIPSEFNTHYITEGVDANGHGIILVHGIAKKEVNNGS